MKALLLLLFILLSSCLSSPAAPDQRIITDPNSLYPDQDYLIALGSGDSRRDAEQDAMGGLARIFKSEIVVDTQSRESYRSLIADNSELSELETKLVQNISIAANQELINVKYSDAFVDQLGAVHIVAYLDRAETGGIYRELIRKNDMRIENFRASARSAESQLISHAFIQAAYVISLANEVLIEQLGIIDPGMEIQIRNSLAEIEEQRLELQSGLRFRIEIDDDDGQVTAFLREELSQRGFAFADDGLLTVRGSIALQPTGDSGEYETIIWELILNLVDENDHIIATVERTNRERALDLDTARLLAMKTVKEIIRTDLMKQLFDYFTTLL